MRKHLVPIALALLLPAAAHAQADSASRGDVSGTVYDSVARAPISGAAVQMVLAANPLEIHSAFSDARGRYLISGVKPGRYLIGFQHEALDTLALSAPIRSVEIRAGERAKADLAVPSPAIIVSAVCGASGAADSTGLLIGMLRDTRTRMPLDTGTVQAVWQELVFDNGRLSSSNQEATGSVGTDGWFALCGIPGAVDVAVLGWRASDSTGLVAFSVPVAGLARHDLFLGGVASLRGSVRSEKDRPIPNARVMVAGRERAAITDSTGAFFLGDVPAGSQTLEIRALGFAPELRPLALPSGSDTTLAVRLTSVKRVLDTIRVVGQRLYSRDSNGFLRRQRMGGGYFFDQETVQRQRPFDLTRLLFQVPSLHQTQRGFNRTFVMRGGFAGGYCTPSLFLNGLRMPADMLGELDFLVRPEELEGMEVYRGTSAPAQFSGFGGCGAIVIWTRPPVRPKR